MVVLNDAAAGKLGTVHIAVFFQAFSGAAKRYAIVYECLAEFVRCAISHTVHRNAFPAAAIVLALYLDAAGIGVLAEEEGDEDGGYFDHFITLTFELELIAIRHAEEVVRICSHRDARCRGRTR